MAKPFLLLDVDGVLNAFDMGSLKPGWNAYPVVAQGYRWVLTMNLALHTEILKDLSEHFDIVWCTTWEDLANEKLSKFFGLSNDLPVIFFNGDGYYSVGPLYGKTPHIRDWVKNRMSNAPFVWVDDMHTEADERFFAANDLTFKLIATDPRIGFTREQADEAIEWAKSLK